MLVRIKNDGFLYVIGDFMYSNNCVDVNTNGSDAMQQVANTKIPT